MSYTKRFIMLLLALSMVVSLAACGGAPMDDGSAEAMAVDESAGGQAEAAPGDAEAAEDGTADAAGNDAAAANAPADPVAQTEPVVSTEGMIFKESPLLADLVAGGELPPVAERLPKDPYVNPAEEIGEYGGTFRGAGFGPTHGQLDTEAFRFVGLLRVDEDLSTLSPMVEKSHTVSEDFREWTIMLREGMKWSDGEPFTSDAFVFWWEDFMLNTDLTPSLPQDWKTGETPMTLEAVDDVTVKVTFTDPNPAFDIVMMRTSGSGMTGMWASRAYLEKYHIKYNPDAEALAKSEGYESWVQCFNAHIDRSQTGTDVNAPDITPWVLRRIDELGNRYHERNPYYFGVDREGNQLPYIDEQMTVIVADGETRTLQLMSGDLYAAGENPLPVADYTLYKENEAQGGYKVYMFENTRGSDCSFTFNLNHTDPVLREIFNDVRFREAMSLAIDRQQVNDVLYFGRATARQAVPPGNTSFMQPWMAEYMVEYDPDGAARRLDEMGLTWDDTHTVRLRPDGEPLHIIVESTEEFAPMAEMVAEMWTAAGVQTDFKQQERSFARERFQTNERDAQCFTFDSAAEFALRANPDKFKPGFVGYEIGFAPLWYEWYNSNKTSGEEPPKELDDLRNQITAWQLLAPGTEEYLSQGEDWLTSFTNQLWYIGLTVAPRVIIISDKLGNTPTEGTFAGDYRFWYPYLGDAWYFK